jgi:hypothetical protein
VPIWSHYDPAIGVWVITGKDSEKGRGAEGEGKLVFTMRSERWRAVDHARRAASAG